MNFQCPGCGQKFRPLSEGTKARCPKCGKALLINQPQQSEPDRLWHVLAADNKPYGPYTDSEMVEFIHVGRITQSSIVSHPNHTGSSWTQASAVEWISRKLPIQAEQDPPRSDPSPPQPPVYKAVNRSQLHDRSGRSGFDFVVDFIDPTFKYYVTPVIISITWVTFLALAILFFVLFTIATIPGIDQQMPLGNANDPAFRNPPSNSRQSLWIATLVFRWVGTGLLILWVRVVLETIIAIFHISNSLRSIDNLAKRRLAG